ncbi:MAG: zinc-dependent peptidase [Ferruginibacter sp.]
MNTTRIKVLSVFGISLLLSLYYAVWPAAIVFGFLTILGFFTTSKESNKEWEDQIAHGNADIEEHCYYGDELKINDEKIISILDKRFPFYTSLNPPQKDKFLQRIKAFMKTKAFKTHDIRGFTEMPVLISAAAIQFSFGLKEFLLPQFEFIHFYPEEFVHSNSPTGFLEGNVSGRSINISWKHFLEGFLYPDDGQNVGLHEMAHAYYYQNFISKENIDKGFLTDFPRYNMTANKIFEQEKKPGYDLFSEYGLKNTQEFWAESAEMFFEKPADMNQSYPELYSAMRDLLNQDPLNRTIQ